MSIVPKIIPNKELSDLPNFPKTWQDYKENYLLVHGNDAQIIGIQKEQIKTYTVNKNPIIKKLNRELRKTNLTFKQEIEESAIANIEHSFHKLRERFQQAESEGRNVNEELQILLREYQDLINKVGSVTSRDYKSLKSVEKSYYKLERAIANLQQYLKNGEFGSYEDFAKLQVINGTSASSSLSETADDDSVSLIKQLAGIGSVLKGLELETEATKELAKRIPEMGLQRVQAVNTGMIRVSIGDSKQTINIKEDIALFDLAFNNYPIQLVDGTFITLKELRKRLAKNIVVSVSEPGYEALQKAMISAVSAKSAQQSNKVILHTGLTVNKILQEVGSNDIRYWALKHMYQLAMTDSSFSGNHDYNKFLVNYNMSKMLTKIIGLKNDFLVTQDGFVSMYSYLLRELNKKNYISVSPVSYRNGMQVQI